MIKTTLILLLSLALAAAAFFTRPSEKDFRELVIEHLGAGSSAGGDPIDRIFNRGRAEAFLSTCEFKDRYLWVEVRRDGQTEFAGAFAHWFNRAALAGAIQKNKDSITTNVKPAVEKAVSEVTSAIKK